MTDTPLNTGVRTPSAVMVGHMAERSNVRVSKRTFRTSEADARHIEQMMADDGYTTFQSWLEYRLFGRQARPRRPGPATDQRPLEGLRSA